MVLYHFENPGTIGLVLCLHTIFLFRRFLVVMFKIFELFHNMLLLFCQQNFSKLKL